MVLKTVLYIALHFILPYVLLSLAGCAGDPAAAEEVVTVSPADSAIEEGVQVYHYKRFNYTIIGEGRLVTEREKDGYYDEEEYITSRNNYRYYSGISTSEGSFEGLLFNGVEYVFTTGDTFNVDTILHTSYPEDSVRVVHYVHCSDTVFF